MAFQKPRKQPTFADLKAILSQTQLDSTTYQLIQTLIDRLTQFQSIVIDQITNIIKSVDDGKGLQGPPGPPGPVNPLVSPHQGTHRLGGTDVLVNNAWTDEGNTFIAPQVINSTLKTTGGYLHPDGIIGMNLSNTVINFFSDNIDFINKSNTIYFMRLSPTGLVVTGTINCAGLTVSGAISAASLALSGNAVIGGIRATSIINSTGLAHGNWNPVDAGVGAGLGAVFFYNARYSRVGNTVTVSGQVDGVATGGGVTSIFRMNLPLYTLQGLTSKTGTGIIANAFGDTGYCDVANASSLVTMQIKVTNAGNQTFYYHFTYETN